MSDSYVIIGIHGLANKPKRSTLDKWWRMSILEGLRRNERRTSGDISFELVYWADWGYTKPIADEDNTEPYIRARGTGPLKRYEDGFWDLLRAEASDWADTPLDWAKQMLGVGRLADAVLEAKLKDLARYYNEAAKRELLRRRFTEAVLRHRDKRIMVIAHSMGSIVAYDVLRLLGREDTNVRVQHFITIGSPLGLPHVKHRIYQENDLVRTPSIVHRWTNLSDKRDPVAFDTHLAGDYRANDRGVSVHDDLVINGYVGSSGDGNPHKSYGYLRTPELSSLIRPFI